MEIVEEFNNEIIRLQKEIIIMSEEIKLREKIIKNVLEKEDKKKEG